MNVFKKLFGVEKSEIRRDCIVTPLNEAQLFSDLDVVSRGHGDYFKVTDTEHATIIGTHYSLLVGDCVLSLKDTPCRNIYLFGCCGGIGLHIGDKILVEKALAFESFTEMLSGKCGAEKSCPDSGLTDEIAEYAGNKLIPGICATAGSLLLEYEYLPLFRGVKVNCVDMECSAVFAAAKKAGKRAAAFFYVSDLIPDKPWHECLSDSDIKRLGQSRKNLAKLLTYFIKQKTVFIRTVTRAHGHKSHVGAH